MILTFSFFFRAQKVAGEVAEKEEADEDEASELEGVRDVSISVKEESWPKMSVGVILVKIMKFALFIKPEEKLPLVQ